MSNSIFIGFSLIRETQYTNLLNKAKCILPDGLIKRSAQYTHTKDQVLSISGWLLLSNMFQQYLGLPPQVLNNIEFEAYGKPVLKGGWAFNISHSGEMLVCALCQHGPIGIDVEVHKAIAGHEMIELIRDQELERFQINEDESFFDLWTKKESFLKAIGTGLSDEQISTQKNGSIISINHEGEIWCCKTLQNLRDAYSISICTRDCDRLNKILVLEHVL